MKRISSWWNKKNAKEKKSFVLRTLICIVLAIVLMALGSAINFTISGLTSSKLLILLVGIIVGYFLGKYFNAEDKEDTKK